MSGQITVAPNPAKVGDSLVVTGTGFEDAGTSEVQHIAVDATGGTFTVTWNGQATTAQAFNVSAANLQAALVALSNIAPGDVVVTGGPGVAGGGTPYILTWSDALGNVAAPTTGVGSLTGGAGTAAVTTTVPGVARPQQTVEIEFIHSSGASDDVRYNDVAVAGALESSANLTFKTEEPGQVTVKARVLGVVVDTVEVEIFTVS